MTEESYRLTELGEHEAIEQLGGQDIANVLGCFMHLLKTKGNLFGTKLEGEGTWEWLCLAPLIRVIKKCENWPSLVVSCEQLLLEETKWFDSAPHSDFWWEKERKR